MTTLWAQITFLDDKTPTIGGYKLYTDKTATFTPSQILSMKEHVDKWFDTLLKEGKNIEIVKEII